MPNNTTSNTTHVALLSEINIEDIVHIAKTAGDAIMEIYTRDFTVEYKDDKSPLTEADLKSNEIICNALNALNSTFNIQHPTFKNIPTPNSELSAVPILSEEGKEIPYEERKNWEYFWLIDPIDGTKEFIKKNDEFTVNIALIHKDTPVLGVVYAPALGDMYYAVKGKGAFKLELSVKSSGFRKEWLENANALPLSLEGRSQNSLVIVASKSHLTKETQDFIDDIIENHPESRTLNPELLSKGSSLKLVMVAEGVADIYPRLAPTMEWDTAAADAIVREAGKMTYQYYPEPGIQNPEPLRYNKENLLNPWFVVETLIST